METVSVVIPCFNAAPYIERAINSAMAQTVQPCEIICVDDGSTDETPEILERLAAESDGFIRFESHEHLGAPYVRNAGLSAAKGEYIQFLDADDVLLPTKFEHQLDLCALEEDGVTIVAGAFLRIPMEGLRTYKCPTYLDPWVNLITSNLGITSANLWRREPVLAAKKRDRQKNRSLMFQNTTKP